MAANSSLTADGLSINCPLISLSMESNVKSFSLELFIVDLRYVYTLLIVKKLLSADALDTGITTISSITFFNSSNPT